MRVESNRFDSISSLHSNDSGSGCIQNSRSYHLLSCKKKIKTCMMVDLRLLISMLKDRSGIPKSRRTIFLLILGLTITFYLFAKWMPHRTTYQNIPDDECLRTTLEQFTNNVADMNAIINHDPIRFNEIVSLPFTGNGYLGLSHSSRSPIQLIPDVQTPFISSGYSPVLQISSNVWEDTRATIIQMNQGLVRRIHCFHINEKYSVSVTHLLYAHRLRSSLIIQEIDIVNPSEQTFDLQFQQNKQISSNNIIQLDQQELTFSSSSEKFLMITNQFSIRQHQFLIYVVITNKDILDSQVKSNSRDKRILFTVTKFSSLLSDNFLHNKTLIKQWQTTLQTQAKEDLSDALSSSPKKLLQEHVNTWSSIWQSGFAISRSLAPSIMNGEVINRTIYYVLSATPSPLYDSKIEETEKTKFQKSLFQIDRCYESHSTLLGDRLWRTPGDDLAVSQLANLWRTTLSKKGCQSLMHSGVNGILQSMLLSIGGIRFHNHHLEMYLEPKDLHRDMFFRSIHFGKKSYINISITVGHDNRAVIDVTIDQENEQAYACDAGCLDPPTKLSTTPTRFPVKMTSPSTAILYISEDLDHISQLKGILHVKEVEIAPPHGSDILALHRHGHKLGGLPFIFWLALAFLIIIFHLFLLKIILNEMGFFKQTFPTYTRARVL